MKHRPKGGMCATCRHQHNDCSRKAFWAMPVIGRDKDGTRVVKCLEHSRSNENREK